MLEPGGVFYMQGKTPSTEAARHKELLARLDALSRQIEELKKGVPGHK